MGRKILNSYRAESGVSDKVLRELWEREFSWKRNVAIFFFSRSAIIPKITTEAVK
jgi:hypothetical protein